MPPAYSNAPLTDESIFPFGVHKGKRMADVPPQYYDWFRGQAWSSKWPRIMQYIDEHAKRINDAVEDEEVDQRHRREDEQSAQEGYPRE